MGQISWFGRGSTGSGAGVRASIRGSAAENWSGTAHGTYLSFSTTAKTTAAPVERMRITDAGNVGIGTTAPPTKLSLQPAAYTSAVDGIQFVSSDNTTHSIIQPIKVAAHDMTKVLSIRQPWAWLIATGLKDIENRTLWAE